MDGPSGTGKSSVSRAVALAAGLPHLDTGAFYRVATLAALRKAAPLDDGRALAEVVANLDLEFEEGRMFLDGEDVSVEIRGDLVTANVSQVSAHPEVREIFVGAQRDWVAEHGWRAVVEGRDIGSVVFPDATIKIYLDARPEVRASRRALQSEDDFGQVFDEIKRRDHLDSTRATSPLTIPEGATVVDTSDLSFDEVVAQIVDMISSRS